MIDLKWNEDIGALVDEEGKKFKGTRISGVKHFKSDYGTRGSESGAEASAVINMQYEGRERNATAYEIVSLSARDTASGQEYCQPEWIAHVDAIFYR